MTQSHICCIIIKHVKTKATSPVAAADSNEEIQNDSQIAEILNYNVLIFFFKKGNIK